MRNRFPKLFPIEWTVEITAMHVRNKVATARKRWANTFKTVEEINKGIQIQRHKQIRTACDTVLAINRVIVNEPVRLSFRG